MKKYLFLFIILIFCNICIGQTDKYGISIAAGIPFSDPEPINQSPLKSDDFKIIHKSYSSGLLANYNLNDTILLRLHFEITNYDIRIFQNNFDNIIHDFDTLIYKQVNIHIAPGIIWNIKNKKIRFNFGYEIPFNIIGKYKLNWTSISTDSLNNNIIYKSQSIETYPKGYSFGLSAILGFSYYPIKHFSISSEFSPSLLYSSYFGKYSRQYKAILPLNGSSTFTSDYNNKGYFYEQRFILYITYWL